MPNSHPRDRFVYPFHQLMINSKYGKVVVVFLKTADCSDGDL